MFERAWRKKVEEKRGQGGGRIGPWLRAEYKAIDERKWLAKGACLYLVGGGDGRIRYVGISRNGLKHRWRTSPAYDADTMIRLPENQLFHSQCWKHLERENVSNPNETYEVRVVMADELVHILEKVGPPLNALVALRGHPETVVASVERWICNNKSNDLAVWNSSMAR